MAIQLALAKAGGIVLIDEIEQGIEPDRIRTIIKKLSRVESGQIFVTTRYRDTLVESKASAIYLMKKGSNLRLTQNNLRVSLERYNATIALSSCCKDNKYL